MDENEESGASQEMQAAMQRIDADWGRRKARLLRSLTETPLDKWRSMRDTTGFTPACRTAPCRRPILYASGVAWGGGIRQRAVTGRPV